MARKTQVILTDDIDGSDANTTITFGLDGVDYEIDLNDGNAQEFRTALEKWTPLARRTGGRARRGTGRSSDAKKIREWAAANGYEVSERGRIPADVREAYAKGN